MKIICSSKMNIKNKTTVRALIKRSTINDTNLQIKTYIIPTPYSIQFILNCHRTNCIKKKKNYTIHIHIKKDKHHLDNKHSMITCAVPTTGSL